jgi:DNA polymerase III delta prime subunit
MNFPPKEIITYILSLLSGEDWVNFSMINKHCRSAVTPGELIRYKLYMLKKFDIEEIKRNHNIDYWKKTHGNLGHTLLVGPSGCGKTVAIGDIVKNKIPNAIVCLHTIESEIDYGNQEIPYALRRFGETQASFLTWLDQIIKHRNIYSTHDMYIVLDKLNIDRSFWRDENIIKLFTHGRFIKTYLIISLEYLSGLPFGICGAFAKLCIFQIPNLQQLNDICSKFEKIHHHLQPSDILCCEFENIRVDKSNIQQQSGISCCEFKNARVDKSTILGYAQKLAVNMKYIVVDRFWFKIYWHKIYMPEPHHELVFDGVD